MEAQRRRQHFLISLLVVLLSTPCMAGEHNYSRLYRLGRRAARAEYSREAVLRLTAAIMQRANEGEPWVKVYGHNFEPYLPHFYLGLAFFELGQYDLALKAWQESEHQNAVKEFPEYAVLLEKRNFIQREVLPQILEAGEAEVNEASVALEEVKIVLESLRAAGTESAEFEYRLAQNKKDLIGSEKALDEAGQQRDIQQIEGVRDSVGITLMKAAALLREVRGQLALLDTAKLDPILLEMMAELRGGSCRRDLLARLLSLQQLASLRPDLWAANREMSVYLGLARAYLQCGELHSTFEQLAAAAQGGAPKGEEFFQLKKSLAEAWEKVSREELEEVETRDMALASFVETAVSIDAGQCDPLAIERLRNSAEAVRFHPKRQQLVGWIAGRAGIPYAPQFYLAKGYMNCGDSDNSTRSFVRSREQREDLPFGLKKEAERIGNWIRREESQRLYSGSHALVILARDYSPYRHGWPDLPGTTEKIERFQNTLEEIGFNDVEILLSPTKRQIEQHIDKFIASFGRGERNRNRLLIYFAGHGWTLTPKYGSNPVPIGFLVPVDAGRRPTTADEEEKFIDSLIGMDQVDQWARRIEAVHALFIFDSCFGGTVFQAIVRGRGGMLPVIVKQAVREPARLFITAGNETQQVPDTSVFLGFLLSALSGEEDADYSRDGFLSGLELCTFLQDRVTRTNSIMPLCGKMPPPYNRGDLIFVKPSKITEHQTATESISQADFEPPLQELSFWKNCLRETDYHKYLDRYPGGRFAGLAHYRLLQVEQSLEVLPPKRN